MFYKSTRSDLNNITSAIAIKTGISAEGGLFVPEKIVKLASGELKKLVELNYNERAFSILSRYLDDYSENDLKECIDKAYTFGKFDDKDIAPIHTINSDLEILELWHGPTCAFKDMALQILPHLLVKSIKMTKEKQEIVILVATSGDTGKAALEGFKNVDGTQIIVFYPNNGVSEIQRLQMVTQEGNNVNSIAVNGNFDDTQTGVKNIFVDKEFEKLLNEKGFKFSSANSINWGRLAPQIVYYFSAYSDMVKKGSIDFGEKINFVVPTGNFGNILAGYYAKEMGLPINKLICASNLNNVLTDFIKTGCYNKNRVFEKTISPSMDILISSNLERFLYHISDNDTELIKDLMKKLNKEGKYQIDDELNKKVNELFFADFCDDIETKDTIKEVFEKYGYVMDTHTSVAYNVYQKYLDKTKDTTKTIIISTASPFKFNDSVIEAIEGKDSINNLNEFELLEKLSKISNLKIPTELNNLKNKEIIHKSVCEKNEMKKIVEQNLFS